MKRTMTCARKFAVFLALASLVSCSLPGTSPKAPKQFYTLQGTGTEPRARTAAAPCVSLRVETPAAAPGFNTPRMAYSREAHRLEYFAYHEWVSPPARMIAAAMAGDLQASGLFTVVLTGSSDVGTDWRLDSELQVLEQDFTSGGSSVRLVIQVNLVNRSERKLVASKTFSYDDTADGQNPESGVAAANRAVQRFLQDLTAFLAESVEKSPCP